MPYRRHRQAGNQQAGHRFDGVFVKIADKKQILFAKGVVIDGRQIGIGVFQGEIIGVRHFVRLHAAAENVLFVVASDDDNVLRRRIAAPALEQVARGVFALRLKGGERVGEQVDFHGARTLEMVFHHAGLQEPHRKTRHEDGADDDHTERGENSLK